MLYLGKLDIDKYRCVSPGISTDEVIITDERIAHIKERHPDDFERYSQYIVQMLEAPQYILEDPIPNTAIVLQEFTDAEEHFRLVLKLAVSGDAAYRKNSVITFMKIGVKTYKKYVRKPDVNSKCEKNIKTPKKFSRPFYSSAATLSLNKLSAVFHPKTRRG